MCSRLEPYVLEAATLAAHELEEAVDALRRVRALDDGSEGAGGRHALHVGGLRDGGRGE